MFSEARFFQKESNREFNFESALFNLFKLLIVVFFVGDVLRKCSFYFNETFTRYSTISKIIGLLILISFFFIHINYYLQDKITFKLCSYIIILSLSFIVGQIALKNSILQPQNLIYNIEYLLKYLYLPILILVFYGLRGNTDFIDRLIFFFELTFYINIVFIILGAIFEIGELKTYLGQRNGYMGLYSRSGQTSYFFIMFTLLSHYKYTLNKTVLNFFKIMFIVSISLLVGTKRIYFFLVLYLLFFIYTFRLYRSAIIYKFSAAILILIAIFFQQIVGYLKRYFDVLLNVYTQDGFLASLSSYRDQLISNVIENFINKNWTFLNYIFGGGSFQDYKYITATELFDLYLFFGVIGVIMYVFLFKQLINYKIHTTFYVFFFGVLAVTSLLSSAFLNDPYVNLLFMLLVWYFGNEYKKDRKIKENIKNSRTSNLI